MQRYRENAISEAKAPRY